MRNMWVIGFFVALAILILVGILVSPVGAVWGGIVLLTAAALAVIASHIVFVHERTALVVCSRQHDGVLRAVPGPGIQFLTPFLEKAGPVMDTSIRLEPVQIRDVLQSDQRPTMLSFTVNVMYQLAPHTVTPRRLGEILPNLTGSLSTIIQRWTDYYLRVLIADTDPAHIHNGHRQRLEHRLERLMIERMATMGVTIRGIQLVIWPPAGLHTTLTTAEQQRVGIALQAEQLDAILAALSDQSEEARSLALLELARALGNNSRMVAAVDLAALMGANGSDTGQMAPPLAQQLALWSGLAYPPSRS